MAEPFLGEIRIMGFSYAPMGWAQCNGQFLPINQNQALFSLLGTTFGGNGQTTFALPDLRGNSQLHVGQGFVLGQRSGQTAHTLTMSEMPMHNHNAMATANNADNVVPGGLVLGTVSNQYTGATNMTTLDPGTVSNVGGSQPHQNMQPYLVLTFCIALQGIFPSPN